MAKTSSKAEEARLSVARGETNISSVAGPFTNLVKDCREFGAVLRELYGAASVYDAFLEENEVGWPKARVLETVSKAAAGASSLMQKCLVCGGATEQAPDSAFFGLEKSDRIRRAGEKRDGAFGVHHRTLRS